jgi:hypothetical protein
MLKMSGSTIMAASGSLEADSTAASISPALSTSLRMTSTGMRAE